MRKARSPVPRIALTGGIGSGKSTVAGLFAALGVPVIDTDVISRQLVQPGSLLLGRIGERFGPGVITTSGELDRRALRNLVFSDTSARADLNALMHPAIRAELTRQCETAGGRYQLLVIPLLVENAMASIAQQVLVVDCAPEEQLHRVRVRDGVTLEQVRVMLAAQASREARLSAADDIIINSGEIGDLRAQVEALHLRYRALSPNP